MRRTKEDELRSRLARILSTLPSRINVEGKVEEDDVVVVRCAVGSNKYMVVLKDRYDAQVYRRVV